MSTIEKTPNPLMQKFDGVYASDAYRTSDNNFTLRDHFAGLAMQGILSSQTEMRSNGFQNDIHQMFAIVDESFSIADEMLKQRIK